MNETRLPVAVEPTEWTVVFHRKASSPWFSFIALGRFKHVSAFAYLAGLNGWVVHDWQYGGLRVAVLPHSDETTRLLVSMFGGPDTEWVQVHRRDGPSSWSGFRIGTCVGAVKHLLGLRGCVAVRPDGLYRHLHGQPVSSAVSAPADRSADPRAAAAGAE